MASTRVESVGDLNSDAFPAGPWQVSREQTTQSGCVSITVTLDAPDGAAECV
ncbi:prepilin-type N-terminal cleavage/methylation domain-containing protein [Shigella flexneri]